MKETMEISKERWNKLQQKLADKEAELVYMNECLQQMGRDETDREKELGRFLEKTDTKKERGEKK